MISMPGEIALVDGAIEGLAGEGLAMQRAIRVAIEEAADLVLQLTHALDRRAYQRPGELLMRQPFAALDRVHEMALDRIARVERHVVAALHHARAAAFTEQALARDRDVETGIGPVGMQRRKQTGAAGAQNQNIGLEAFKGHRSSEHARQQDERDDGRYSGSDRRKLLLSVAPIEIFDHQQSQPS